VTGMITAKDSLDPVRAQVEIERLLHRGQAASAEMVDETTKFAARLPQLLGISSWIELVGQLTARMIRSRKIVKLLRRAGAEFYRTALRRPPKSDFYEPLVELARLARESNQVSKATVDRVLCEAFLADLAEGYRRGFRPTNCLALIDNVHTEAGRAFLTALTTAKTGRSDEHRPLVVVATSRRIDPLTQMLTVQDRYADYVSLWSRVQRDTDARFTDWLDRHSQRPQAWLYPLRLTDLTEDGVLDLKNELHPDLPDGLVPFVRSLTRGHPWGVIKVLDALAERGARHRELPEAELQAVLETTCSGDTTALGDIAAGYLLLNDLEERMRPSAITWSAARDVVTAEKCLPESVGLQTMVAPLGWLSTPDTVSVLHPWLRRVLLRKLACATDADSGWSTVYEKLLAGCGNAPTERGHYELATENAATAIMDLNRRFDADELDASGWIAEFNAITSAPHRQVGDKSALKLHAQLKKELLKNPPTQHQESDPHDDQWLTIVGMALARWIWSDALCDPTSQMNSIIATGYRDLARRSPQGELRFIVEAEFYERGGRP
jgi:hypothetical protein